jgi:hypothetical protein
MNTLSSCHSSQVSRLSDGQAAHRGAVVAQVIDTGGQRDFAAQVRRRDLEAQRRAGASGIVRFTVSMKTMYGSPVASRVSTSFWNSARASTVLRTLNRPSG